MLMPRPRLTKGLYNMARTLPTSIRTCIEGYAKKVEPSVLAEVQQDVASVDDRMLAAMFDVSAMRVSDRLGGGAEFTNEIIDRDFAACCLSFLCVVNEVIVRWEAKRIESVDG